MKKKLTRYPFLILWGLGALGSLALGARGALRRGEGDLILQYTAAHKDTPFWTDLMPDRFLDGQEMAFAEGEAFGREELGPDPEEAPEATEAETTAPETQPADRSGAETGPGEGSPEAGPQPGETPLPGDATEAGAPEPSAPEQSEADTGIYFDEEYGLWMAKDAVYRTYEPVETKSPYYQDRGLIPLTPDYGFTEVEDDYFADAAFIGDSRMLGLHDYSGWSGSADFYCENGFSVYRWTKGAKTTLQSAEAKGKGTQVDLKEALSSKTYGKVYLLAGMNDLGYGNTELFQGWIQQLIDMVRETQPDATIYLLGNLHISKSQDDVQPAMNNINTNDKNLALSGLADGETIFYLDANDLFCDEEGYLNSEITFDGYHLYAANYVEWADFIRQHAVIR